MPLDFDIYTTPEDKSWKPPVSDEQQRKRSRKIAVSSRVYPEYLFAVYAFFQQKHGITLTSISDIIYHAVCECINQNREVIDMIPPPQFSLDQLIKLGMLTGDNKEHRTALDQIASEEAELEQRVLSGHATPGEQYKYWSSRDPQKAEKILDDLAKQVSEGLASDTPPSKQESGPTFTPAPKDEKIDEVHARQGGISLDDLSSLPGKPTGEEDTPSKKPDKPTVKDSSGIATPDWLLELDQQLPKEG